MLHAQNRCDTTLIKRTTLTKSDNSKDCYELEKMFSPPHPVSNLTAILKQIRRNHRTF